MSEAAKVINREECEVIQFPIKKRKKFIPDNTDTIKKTYAFKTEKEITDVLGYYENKATEATDNNKKIIAARNVMMITVGINMGIRAGDLLGLKWHQVFNEDGTFIEESDENQIREQKTGKIKGLIYNDSCREAIMDYVNKYNIEINPNDYLFPSRKSDNKGNKRSISVNACGKILSEAAIAVGIRRNIASHSMRKTFSWFQIKAHNDDSMFINELMSLLNHDKPETTLNYAGLSNERLKQYHDDVNLGKKCVIKSNVYDKVMVEKEELLQILNNCSDIEIVNKIKNKYEL